MGYEVHIGTVHTLSGILAICDKGCIGHPDIDKHDIDDAARDARLSEQRISETENGILIAPTRDSGEYEVYADYARDGSLLRVIIDCNPDEEEEEIGEEEDT